MPDIRTRAGRVTYTDTGEGPVLLLLHATLHDRHDYDPVLAVLARDHRVLALDWPGHGDSDRDAGGLVVTAPLLADVLEEVVLGLDLHDVRLIGNSVGGFAAANWQSATPTESPGSSWSTTAVWAPTTRSPGPSAASWAPQPSPDWSCPATSAAICSHRLTATVPSPNAP